MATIIGAPVAGAAEVAGVAGVAGAAGVAAAAATADTVPTPIISSTTTATPVGSVVSKDDAATNAMFDFMPGGPPKLPVVKEEPSPTGTSNNESTPTSETTSETTPEAPTADVKILTMGGPTPEMPGPAQPVPTVIREATDNPLIAEGDSMPTLPMDDAVSIQAVKGEPTPDIASPVPVDAEARPRRSSMKGGRAAVNAQTPSSEFVAGDNVKVIKIDA
jgi:hypothetical protein